MIKDLSVSLCIIKQFDLYFVTFNLNSGLILCGVRERARERERERETVHAHLLICKSKMASSQHFCSALHFVSVNLRQICCCPVKMCVCDFYIYIYSKIVFAQMLFSTIFT